MRRGLSAALCLHGPHPGELAREPGAHWHMGLDALALGACPSRALCLAQLGA